MTFVQREESLLLDRLRRNVHRSLEGAVSSRLSASLDCILFCPQLNISYHPFKLAPGSLNSES